MVLWETSQNSQENICAEISFLDKVKLSVDLQLHKKRDSTTGVFCQFYKTRKIFFAEHHQTTASDYSSINC